MICSQYADRLNNSDFSDVGGNANVRRAARRSVALVVVERLSIVTPKIRSTVASVMSDGFVSDRCSMVYPGGINTRTNRFSLAAPVALPTVSSRTAGSPMTELVPVPPFADAEAMNWLRSRSDGRATTSGAALGLQ
jgi:hypothetical protein